jgi:hypothetical protein
VTAFNGIGFLSDLDGQTERDARKFEGIGKLGGRRQKHPVILEISREEHKSYLVILELNLYGYTLESVDCVNRCFQFFEVGRREGKTAKFAVIDDFAMESSSLHVHVHRCFFRSLCFPSSNLYRLFSGNVYSRTQEISLFQQGPCSFTEFTLEPSGLPLKQ